MRKLFALTAGTGWALWTLMASGGAALAHPHVWIDARLEAVFNEEQRMTELRVSWRFDEFYSLFAIEGLDKNGDSVLDAAELQPLAELNVTSLEEYRYFTQISVDGAAAAYGPVTDYGSRYEEGILSLNFVIPLATPIDPRGARISIKSYDPSFYIAIEPPLQEPVVFDGSPPPQCRVVEEAGESSETLTLSEADFLDPNANEGLGALYATEFSILCDGTQATQ